MSLPGSRINAADWSNGVFPPTGALRPGTPWPRGEGALWPSSVTPRVSTAASTLMVGGEYCERSTAHHSSVRTTPTFRPHYWAEACWVRSVPAIGKAPLVIWSGDTIKSGVSPIISFLPWVLLAHFICINFNLYSHQFLLLIRDLLQKANRTVPA